MKQIFLFSLSMMFVLPAFARTVECTGKTSQNEFVYVSLARASQTHIAGVIVNIDDEVLFQQREEIVYDRNYRPTPRYFGYQRFAVTGETSGDFKKSYLILPEDKSGQFVGFLQKNMGHRSADTIRMRCLEF